MHGGGNFSPAVFSFFGKEDKMKGFVRANQNVGLCGLSCGLCSMKMGGYCPGCGGGGGNQSCAMAKCSMERGNFAYCVECSDYPCEKYKDFDQWDSFITHQNREKEMCRLLELGEEAYTTEIIEKRKLLETLLAECNGGRKKTFYFLAVNLLPLSMIREILEQGQTYEDWAEMSPKMRENLIVPLLQKEAKTCGVELKLRKKV